MCMEYLGSVPNQRTLNILNLTSMGYNMLVNLKSQFALHNMLFSTVTCCDIVLLFFSCFSAGLPLQGTLLEKKSYLLNLLLRFPFLFLIEKN